MLLVNGLFTHGKFLGQFQSGSSSASSRRHGRRSRHRRGGCHFRRNVHAQMRKGRDLAEQETHGKENKEQTCKNGHDTSLLLMLCFGVRCLIRDMQSKRQGPRKSDYDRFYDEMNGSREVGITSSVKSWVRVFDGVRNKSLWFVCSRRNNGGVWGVGCGVMDDLVSTTRRKTSR